MSYYLSKANCLFILLTICYFLIRLKIMNSQIDSLTSDVSIWKFSSEQANNLLKLELKKLTDRISTIEMICQRKPEYFGKSEAVSVISHGINKSKITEVATMPNPSLMNDEPLEKHLLLIKIHSSLGIHGFVPDQFNAQKQDDFNAFTNLRAMNILNENNVPENISAKVKQPKWISKTTSGLSPSLAPYQNFGIETIKPTNQNVILGSKGIMDTNQGDLFTRTGRSKRSNNRGIMAAHFQGAVPETVINNGGLIAPWFRNEIATGVCGLNFKLQEGRGAVQVPEDGLYLVYAQVYYLTGEILNSFTINLRHGARPLPSIPIASCSANASLRDATEISEISCYTAVVRFLSTNDTIFLRQREKNRRLIMKDGFTFFGLIRLETWNPGSLVSSVK